jgi:hypothetical protein
VQRCGARGGRFSAPLPSEVPEMLYVSCMHVCPCLAASCGVASERICELVLAGWAPESCVE